MSPDRDPGGRRDRGAGCPRPRHRRLRGPLAVTTAVLVPTGLVGWLLWQAASPGQHGSGQRQSDADRPQATAHATPPAVPKRPATSEQAGPSASASGSGDRTPGSTRSGGGADGPLAGKVVVIDPGHNPGNRDHPREINRRVDVGTGHKECDTTGTATNSGYPEAEFTLDVARRLEKLLETQGAKVILTQDGHRAWGPCVDERARIGNAARADAAISLHADGSTAGSRGFHVILPKPVQAGAADTRGIAAPSRDLGERVVGRFVQYTGAAPADYVGAGTGLDVRDDLGGLNLSTVPKVFVECANMRNAKDAALVTSGAWRQKAAQGLSTGIESFLRSSS